MLVITVTFENHIFVKNPRFTINTLIYINLFDAS